MSSQPELKKSSRQWKPNINIAIAAIEDEKRSIKEEEKFEVATMSKKGQSSSKTRRIQDTVRNDWNRKLTKKVEVE